MRGRGRCEEGQNGGGGAGEVCGRAEEGVFRGKRRCVEGQGEVWISKIGMWRGRGRCVEGQRVVCRGAGGGVWTGENGM